MHLRFGLALLAMAVAAHALAHFLGGPFPAWATALVAFSVLVTAPGVERAARRAALGFLLLLPAGLVASGLTIGSAAGAWVSLGPGPWPLEGLGYATVPLAVAAFLHGAKRAVRPAVLGGLLALLGGLAWAAANARRLSALRLEIGELTVNPSFLPPLLFVGHAILVVALVLAMLGPEGPGAPAGGAAEAEPDSSSPG